MPRHPSKHSLPKLLWLIIPAVWLASRLRAEVAVQAWVQRYDASGGDAATALAVGASGTVYVIGTSTGSSEQADFVAIAYASTGNSLWTNRFRGPDSIYDYAEAAAVDHNVGNLYVAGESYRTALLNHVTTIAYSITGAPLWTNRYNAPSSCCAYVAALSVGSNGDVYLAGSVGGMAADYAVVAYSNTGTPLWTNRFNGPANGIDALQAMVVGSEGTVHVSGFSYGNGSGRDYLTIAYSVLGVPLWTNRFNGPANGSDIGAAMAAASTGDVIVAGQSDGISTGSDYATIGYAKSGISLWTNRFNGTGNSDDIVAAVAVDRHSDGNVYVTGASKNEHGAYDFATVAYTGNGTPLWTNRYGSGGSLASSAIALTLDDEDRIIVTGWSEGMGTGMDYVTVAYSSNGVALWTNRYNGPISGDDGAGALAVGPGGALYVTGNSFGFNNGVTNSDIVTIKYVPVPDITFTGARSVLAAGFRLTISAPVNTPYRLEASGDLSNWLTLTNFPPLPRSRIHYTDAEALGFPRRYYRTVWNP